jgi:hypothetical protein
MINLPLLSRGRSVYAQFPFPIAPNYFPGNNCGLDSLHGLKTGFDLVQCRSNERTITHLGSKSESR